MIGATSAVVATSGVVLAETGFGGTVVGGTNTCCFSGTGATVDVAAGLNEFAGAAGTETTFLSVAASVVRSVQNEESV